MSRGPNDSPERLLAGDATEFERRMMDALLEKRPSAAASARMARALGVSVTSIGTAAASKALAAKAGGSTMAAGTGASAAWAWISVGVVGLVTAGAVVGGRGWHARRPEPAPVPAARIAPAAPQPADVGPLAPSASATVDRTPMVAGPVHRDRLASRSGDLADEIALIDAAREALAAGAPQRALELLRRYQTRYALGNLRPEAAATTIEALVKLGRQAEARALATRFVAQHRGTLLAARVSRLVELSNPRRHRSRARRLALRASRRRRPGWPRP